VAALAQQDATAESKPTPQPSALDATLFYHLLIGEIELRSGQPGIAYELVLDAARRTRSDQLFRRAVDIALQSRSGEQALGATKAWRQSLPESTDAMRAQLQILVALNRLADTAEPLHALLAQTPESDRNPLIASLPRFFNRVGDPKAAAELVEKSLQPYLASPATRAVAMVAVARMWLAAGDVERPMALLQSAAAADPRAPGPPLLALELMGRQPAAEAVVVDYLRSAEAEPAVRLAYARVLLQAQRHADAIAQLEQSTRQQPELAAPWLTLGALHLELRQPQQAEQALLRYVELVQREAAAHAGADDDDTDDDADGLGARDREAGLVQAWLLLAQAAEMRGDFAAAEAHLAKVDSPQRALEVQTRRATMVARQGRVAEARELIRKLPDRNAEEARAKVAAEAQVLRDVKRWRESYDLLAGAVERWPDDIELLYELAMMAEKLDRMDEMERRLRRVIELKPDHQHAYNALGYSLADRGVRLAEARELIRKALELAPGDPFITDSLGWVEFRMGNHAEALRLLQKAYASRPDTEIAAHLGEVLWVMGRRDEARRIWREGASRDSTNEVLRETLARLKPGL
jgi:tetratricopeptide (TPR) repeat protein